MKKIICAMILGASLLFGGFIPCACSQAPGLSLQDSIPVAEKALAEAKIDISQYYLYDITLNHSSKGDFWYYTYRSSTDKYEYNQVFVKVYMDKQCEVIDNS